MKRLASVALVQVLLAITLAEAGIGAKNGEFGFDFGYAGFDADFPGGNGGRLAVRGGYHLTSLFQIEGQYSASYDFDTGSSSPSHVQLSSATVNGVFNFHPGGGNIVPYGLAGAGYVDLLSDFPDGDDTSVGWQAGIGSRFFFGDHDQVAFRLEYVRLFSDLAGVSTKHDFATAGFTWRLGAGR